MVCEDLTPTTPNSLEMDHSLLCDEEWLTSPTACDTAAPMEDSLDVGVVVGTSFYTTREDRDQALRVCLQKESSYLPGDGYMENLQASDDFLNARFRAVQWIIRAQCRLNLSIGSVFDAVNYLDRYMWVNRGMKWEYWIVELLSIACLSIASKCNEVSIPSLLEFQMADLDRSFQAETIQQMELTVLKALGWRLSCVTAYSYVDLMTWHLHPHLHVALTARTTELLLGALSDPKFIEFRPCIVAASALRCGLEELLPLKLNAHLYELASLLPHDHTDELKKCHKRMEEQVADPQEGFPSACRSYALSSPVSVMAPERIYVCDCYSNITLLSITNPPMKRKREVEMGLRVEDDHGPISQPPIHKQM